MEKLKKWMLSRRHNSHLMRLLVGGYVTYLGIQILLNQYRDGSFEAVLTLCALLLILLALPLTIISLYAALMGYSVEYKGKMNSQKTEEPEESPEQIEE